MQHAYAMQCNACAVIIRLTGSFSALLVATNRIQLVHVQYICLPFIFFPFILSLSPESAKQNLDHQVSWLFIYHAYERCMIRDEAVELNELKLE
jgi:hypothetical protein